VVQKWVIRGSHCDVGLPRNARTGDEMDSVEIQAKATIAAALIMREAVAVPSMPPKGGWLDDAAAVRLRDLTDYVYQALTAPNPRDSI
jgi:hypothetical protein